MKQKSEQLTYESAYAELQQLVGALQEEMIDVDQLTARIERARMLIQFCRERLRQTEDEIGKLLE